MPTARTDPTAGQARAPEAEDEAMTRRAGNPDGRGRGADEAPVVAGTWASREVTVGGEPLSPSESLAVARRV